MSCPKPPAASASGAGRAAATTGTVNPAKRKQWPDDSYQPRTVQHGNAVVHSFYEFWIEAGSGPLVNPVVLDRRGRRANAHHNPPEPFGGRGRIRYNPKVPVRRPREVPDEQWNVTLPVTPTWQAGEQCGAAALPRADAEGMQPLGERVFGQRAAGLGSGTARTRRHRAG